MKKQLSSIAASVFCENMAMMLSAGIPVDEALSLLCEDSEQGTFHEAAQTVYRAVMTGVPLAQAVRECGLFPQYMSDMIEAGELAGRTDSVLRMLSVYYETQHHLGKKLKSAVVYPAALLLLMAVVLGILVFQVLPVFTGVYASLAGSMAASAYSYIRVAYVVGGIALGAVVVLALFLLAGLLLARTEQGKTRLLNLFEKFPLTAGAYAQLAQAQFVTALATFVASGMNTDLSMERAVQMVQHKALHEKLNCAMEKMAAGNSLAQAFYEEKIFEPLYNRMLLSGARSGQLENVLERLSKVFSAEADTRIELLIGNIEPILSGLLTLAVGLTLLSVMLPLVGILAAVG